MDNANKVHVYASRKAVAKEEATSDKCYLTGGNEIKNIHRNLRSNLAMAKYWERGDSKI